MKKMKGKNYANRKPETEDGKVECGMMVTGWFVWNRNYEGLPKINVLDMQKYILRKGKTK